MDQSHIEKRSSDKEASDTRLNWEKLVLLGFCAGFLATIIVLAVFFPRPTAFQYLVFRVILGLSAAGVASFIPGVIEVRIKPMIKAGGAVAVFVIIYSLNPARLIPGLVPPDSATSGSVEKLKYAGRVVNALSEVAVRGAKVSLDIQGQGSPMVAYTDSEGVYTFFLQLGENSPVPGRIRVEAEGYDNFDRNISVSNTTPLEDIRLHPAKQPTSSGPASSRHPEDKTARRRKLAFATGGAVAMLGRAREETGRTIFEKALSDLGVPPSQVGDLVQDYRSLDRALRSESAPNLQAFQSANMHILSAVDEQLRVLLGSSILVYVTLGYEVCKLALMVQLWESLAATENPLTIAQASLYSVQKRVSTLDLPRQIGSQVMDLTTLELRSSEGRSVIQHTLMEVINYFDMEPLMS